jgi:hypothetical protein
MTHGMVEIGIAAQIGIGAYGDAIRVDAGLRWLFTSATPGLATTGQLPPDVTGRHLTRGGFPSKWLFSVILGVPGCRLARTEIRVSVAPTRTRLSARPRALDATRRQAQ